MLRSYDDQVDPFVRQVTFDCNLEGWIMQRWKCGAKFPVSDHAYLGYATALTVLCEAQEICAPCHSFMVRQLIPQTVARHNYE
jgi:hypothetical protein